MKINGEEVELVTDRATLRDGMIVYLGPCDVCRKMHRGLLLSLSAVDMEDIHPDDLPVCARGLKISPSPACLGRPYRFLVVDITGFPGHNVFRVVDGLDLEAEKRAEEKARPVKRELVDADPHPNCRCTADPILR